MQAQCACAHTTSSTSKTGITEAKNIQPRVLHTVSINKKVYVAHRVLTPVCHRPLTSQVGMHTCALVYCSSVLISQVWSHLVKLKATNQRTVIIKCGCVLVIYFVDKISMCFQVQSQIAQSNF